MCAYVCVTGLVTAERSRSFDAANHLAKECIEFVDVRKTVVKIGRLRTEFIDAKSNTDLHFTLIRVPIGDGVHREPPTVTPMFG